MTPLYPGPVQVVDNGDGHYRVSVAAEPGLAIYPSVAEWAELEAAVRTKVAEEIAHKIEAEADRWRLLGYDGDGFNITAVRIARTGSAAPEPCHYCTQCGKPLPAEDTAAGRRVCGECGVTCKACLDSGVCGVCRGGSINEAGLSCGWCNDTHRCHVCTPTLASTGGDAS